MYIPSGISTLFFESVHPPFGVSDHTRPRIPGPALSTASGGASTTRSPPQAVKQALAQTPINMAVAGGVLLL